MCSCIMTKTMVKMMKYVVLVLLVSLSMTTQTASSEVEEGNKTRIGPRRSILRSLNERESTDFAVDLNSSNFDQVLKDVTTPWAIVEFFAHWCPACRNYKPHYEKVARLFNGADAVYSGIIFMARVDCAMKINTNLCDKFSVSHFPMLFWGPTAEFVSGRWRPKEKSKIQVIDDARTADRLLNWINKQVGRAFKLDDDKTQKVLPDIYNVSESGQIFQALFDVEESTAKAFDIILEHKMIKPDTRAPLIQFLQLLVAHHPSKRCQRGSAEVLANFDDMWPLDLLTISTKKDVPIENDTLGRSVICGEEVPRGYWLFCRGSRNDTRGFSCGLWVLFHSLSVRIDDGESQFAFSTICNFICNFFICEECRQDFHKICSSVSTPFSTARDFAMWLWKTHNNVNLRLRKEEAALHTGDPKFPKGNWPSRLLCPSCYISENGKEDNASEVKWNETEVFRFLTNYYGKAIKSASGTTDLSQRRVDMEMADDLSSSNVIAVPVGAALAIAFASCAFGALACFWRSQQKGRKYSHQLHPLKNI